MFTDVWQYLLLRGVFALALGAFALFWPSLSLSVLVTVVGIFCLIDGAIGLVFTLRNPALRTYLASSLVSLIIGAILVIWSVAAVKFVLMMFGAWLVFVGGSQIAVARGLGEKNANRGLLLTLGAVAAVVGLVLIVWPGTGVVVVSWGIAAAAILTGIQSVYLATHLRRVQQSVRAPEIPG
jgi:uncharacterized membrane protein HdeD (DUF308 family)